MRKILTLVELSTLAREDERYARLAMDAARNLGGSPNSVDAAMRWLYMNADETNSERGVVAEVNLCRPEEDRVKKPKAQTKRKPAREPRERTISSATDPSPADPVGPSEQPEEILPEAQNIACLQETPVVDSSASSTITNGPTATEGHKIMVILRKRKTDKSGSTSYSIDGLKSSVYFNKGMFAGEPPDTIEINADASIFAQPGSQVKAAAPKLTAEERKAEAARKKAEFDALSPAQKAALKLEAARAALAKLEAAVAASSAE